jgi:hypothetical protein
MSTDPLNTDGRGGALQGNTERLRQIIHDYLVRRSAGKTVSAQALLDAHPDLKTELAETPLNTRINAA